jgi:hypothetical protein
VFNQVEVGKILALAKAQRGNRIRWEFYYAITPVCDGVGIRLMIGYQPDMSKREGAMQEKPNPSSQDIYHNQMPVTPSQILHYPP